MNVQKEERVEDSLELLMECEEGEVLEDSFDNIQEKKNKMTMKKKKKFHQYNLYIDLN